MTHGSQSYLIKFRERIQLIFFSPLFDQSFKTNLNMHIKGVGTDCAPTPCVGPISGITQMIQEIHFLRNNILICLVNQFIRILTSA